MIKAFKKDKRDLVFWIDMIVMISSVVFFMLVIESLWYDWALWAAVIIAVIDLGLELGLFFTKYIWKHKVITEEEYKEKKLRKNGK